MTFVHDLTLIKGYGVISFFFGGGKHCQGRYSRGSQKGNKLDYFYIGEWQEWFHGYENGSKQIVKSIDIIPWYHQKITVDAGVLVYLKYVIY